MTGARLSAHPDHMFQERYWAIASIPAEGEFQAITKFHSSLSKTCHNHSGGTTVYLDAAKRFIFDDGGAAVVRGAKSQ
jgi:hypothetical protein